MLKLPALFLALTATGCWIVEPEPDPDPIPPGERVEIMTVTPNLDLLFVIDDSGTMSDKQNALRQAFPAFMAQLDAAPGGRPNLHVGVISTDMGTKGRLDTTPGPAVGTVGQGGCSNIGKGGKLLINGAPIIPNANGDQEPFLSTDRLGNANFDGTLEDAFTAMATLGATGCGFEQQLHATRVALDGEPANAGFLRPGANLGIVMLTDEDDCSMTHSTLLGPDGGELGPQQSFRCFRFGVTCAEDTSTVGGKTNCQPAATSELVEEVAPFADFLAGVKSHANRVMFGVVMGAPDPVAVELRSINGQMQPAVTHSCDLSDPSRGFSLVADPGVRLDAMASQFAALGGLSHVDSICSEDLGPQAIGLGEQLATLVDNTCLPTAVSARADCIVEDRSDFQATAETLLPCTGADAPGTSCFRILDDATCSSGQRLDFTRPIPPLNDRASTLKCSR